MIHIQFQPTLTVISGISVPTPLRTILFNTSPTLIR
jgi:hypothetical protein